MVGNRVVVPANVFNFGQPADRLFSARASVLTGIVILAVLRTFYSVLAPAAHQPNKYPVGYALMRRASSHEVAKCVSNGKKVDIPIQCESLTIMIHV